MPASARDADGTVAGQAPVSNKNHESWSQEEPEGRSAFAGGQRHERLDTRPSRGHGAPTILGTAAAVDPQIDRIVRTPEFQQLVAERTQFGWILTDLMLVVYFGFIGLIAFDKSLMAVKVGGGTASLGLFMGVFVILFAFPLTGIYVARANTRFDALSDALQAKGVGR